MSEPQSEPGWYYAQGDPVGTQRYWDGSHWVGGPVPQQGIQTPNSDSIHRQYGTAIERLGANIIDSIIIAIPIIIVAVAFGDSTRGLLLGTWFGVAIGAAYSIGFVGLRGATPGKSLLGMEVVRADTGETPPGVDVAAKRWVLALAGLLPGIGRLATFGIAIACGVMISNDGQNRSLYDRVANTLVVKR